MVTKLGAKLTAVRVEGAAGRALSGSVKEPAAHCCAVPAALAGLLFMLACGGDTARDVAADLNPGAGGASGGASGIGTSGAGTGDAEAPPTPRPPRAPACTNAAPSFASVEVFATTSQSALRGLTSFEGMVVAAGTDLPPELVDRVDGQGPWGWIEVGAATPSEASDAGASPATPDAGASPPVAADSRPATGRRWWIVGRPELATVPVVPGDRVAVALRRTEVPLYLPPVHTLLVTSGERVLLLHERARQTALLEVSGFSVALGEALCQTSIDCYYHYQHTLRVQTPGSGSETIEPGGARRVGDYRVWHGVSGSQELNADWPGSVLSSSCADIYAPPFEVTAVLLPQAAEAFDL